LHAATHRLVTFSSAKRYRSITSPSRPIDAGAWVLPLLELLSDGRD